MNSIPLVTLEEILEEIKEDAGKLEEAQNPQYIQFVGTGMNMAVSKIYSMIWELMDEEEEE